MTDDVEYWIQEIEDEDNNSLAQTLRDADDEQLSNEAFMKGLKQAHPDMEPHLDALLEDLNAEDQSQSSRFPIEKYQSQTKTKKAQAYADWLIEEELIRPVVIDGRTLFYNYDRESKVWNQVDFDMIMKLPHKHLGQEFTRHFISQFKKSFRNHHKFMEYEEMGLNPSEILMKNGKILDLEEKSFRPAMKEDKALNCINAVYQEGIEPDGIKKFLKRTIDTEDGLKTLQEYLGCILTWPESRYEKALLILGDTDTGKSTLLEVLEKFFDDSETSNLAFPDIGMKRAFHVEELKDAVVNLDHDMDDKEISSYSRIKKAISNNRMHADPKGEKGFKFRPRARFIIASNDSPDDSGAGEAFYNRFLTIQANTRVPEEDKDRQLVDKLCSDQNLSWLLKWSIKGLERLREQNRFTGERSEYETKKLWDKFGSSTQRFIHDQINIDREEGKNIPTTDLYEAYEIWCEEQLEEAIPQRQFIAQAASHPDMIKRKTEDYTGAMRSCFINIEMKDYAV
jgi:P4 family phage/plasmid primase-like protien